MMTPPGGEIILCFVHCLLYHMQKIFYPAYLYPSGELHKFCGDLKKRANILVKKAPL